MEFNESNTKTQCFFTKPNNCTNVSMMNVQDKIKYGYISDINAQAIELLYKASNTILLYNITILIVYLRYLCIYDI